MQSLMKFPNELLLQVSSDLTARDLNALLRTNKFFARLLTTPLRTLATQDVYGTPALVWAADRGHYPLIAYLLTTPIICVNAADPLGVTALHKASINGDAAVVRLLLENGADVHAIETKMGATPLHWAALYARREIVQVLVAAGADVNRVSGVSARTPLQMACVARHGLEGRWVRLGGVGEGVDIGELQERAETAVVEVVSALLAHGAHTWVRDNTGKTVLHLAVKHVGKWGHHGSTLPQVLIEAGAEMGVLDHLGWTELQTAALYGCVSVVQMLLEKGAKIEDANPATALHVAVHHGKVEVVRLLLEKGADVDVRDRKGKTPLHEAVLGAPPELRRLLSKSRVDVIQGAKEEMVRMLLRRGARVDAVDPKGKTALHYAASVRDAVTVAMLLENEVAPADVTVKDEKGRTPRQYAEENGWMSVVEVLRCREEELGVGAGVDGVIVEGGESSSSSSSSSSSGSSDEGNDS
ncbi:uncharacterized protein H6S33_005437 [Morchella sextelata]|uniref:uncharacterized protein n=1 Tax=Morchella sextelata TaxID=1174677 RepID=UPI001D041337|nr:uncharacterized protein H6S33_005437 [Morchella sextelata]KAH0613551.1 hypothetical protein H6S33_005437 [Morchella sextelata]